MSRLREVKKIDGKEHFQCSSCLQWKEKKDFFKHNNFFHKITSRCAFCHSKYIADLRGGYDEHQNKDREYRRELIKKKGCALSEQQKATHKKWLENNKEKVSAHNAVRYALLTGKIKKAERCFMCDRNEFRLFAHHHDYKAQLDVVWICTECLGVMRRRKNRKHDID